MQYPESISSEELTQLDHVDFTGPIVVVSDLDEDFVEAMDYLKSQRVIGFDTETKPSFTSSTPRHHVALIGAAVKDDVRGLMYYRKFTPRGFVDLQSMVADYGIMDKSVRKMSAIILGKKVSKTQQLSNWEAQQLSGAQLKYAAIDAWVCREMYLKLKSDRQND